jgi:hypothetical protein
MPTVAGALELELNGTSAAPVADLILENGSYHLVFDGTELQKNTLTIIAVDLNAGSTLTIDSSAELNGSLAMAIGDDVTASFIGGDDGISVDGNNDTITAAGGSILFTLNGGHESLTATSGNDSLYDTPTGGNDTLSFSGGNDQISLQSSGNTVTFGTGADTLSLGGSGNAINLGGATVMITDNVGANTFNVATGADTLGFTSAASTTGTLDVINNFTDTGAQATVIDLSSFGSTTHAFGGKIAGSFTSAAAAFGSDAPNTVDYATINGNTYIHAAGGSGGYSTSDLLIELAGAHTLTGGIGAGHNVHLHP